MRECCLYRDTTELEGYLNDGEDPWSAPIGLSSADARSRVVAKSSGGEDGSADGERVLDTPGLPVNMMRGMERGRGLQSIIDQNDRDGDVWCISTTRNQDDQTRDGALTDRSGYGADQRERRTVNWMTGAGDIGHWRHIACILVLNRLM